MNDFIYVIFRVYPRGSKLMNYQYGWSDSKFLTKEFMHQRDNDKYEVRQVFEYDTPKNRYEGYQVKSMKLDMVKLFSKTANDYIYIITTASELVESESRLLEYFRELPKLHAPENETLEEQVALFMLLKDEYRDALDYLGFRPAEVKSLYDESEYEINYSPSEGLDLSLIDEHSEPWVKSLYSLEGLIMMMKEDF